MQLVTLALSLVIYAGVIIVSCSAAGKNRSMVSLKQVRKVAEAVTRAKLTSEDWLTYNCMKQGKYLDHTGECKKCADLCRNGDLVTCKQRCATEYVQIYQIYALKEQLDFYKWLICGLGVGLALLTVASAYVAYLLWKRTVKEPPDSQSPKNEGKLKADVSQLPLLVVEAIGKAEKNNKEDNQFVSLKPEKTEVLTSHGCQQYPPNNVQPSEDQSTDIRVD